VSRGPRPGGRRARRAGGTAAARSAPPPGGIPAERRAGAAVRQWLVTAVRRHPVWLLTALAAVHIFLALASFAPQPHTGGDNAAYITLARSLLERGAYLELWDPAAPPHTKYPPVFPAVLALAMAAGLQPWVQLKFVVLGFSTAGVVFSFLWLRRLRQAGLALGVALILAVAPGVLQEGRWLLSDVPFWAFTMLALWAFDRLRPDDWRRFALAAAAVLLAYFTRSAGLPLVLAAFGWLALRRHWRQFAVLAVVIGVPAVMWWARGRAFATAGYVSEFWLRSPYEPALGTIGAGDLLLRLVENAHKYVTIHLPILLSGGRGPLLTGVATLVFALALAGWIQRLRLARPRAAAAAGRGSTGDHASRGDRASRGDGRGVRTRPIGVAELLLPLYIGLIFVWPAVWSGERFLLPVLPLLLYYAGAGLGQAARWTRRRYDFAAGALAAVLLIAVAAPGLVSASVVGRICTARYFAGERYPCLHPASEDFFRLAEETGSALPADAVVLTRKPRLFHVLSGGLRSRNYPLTADVDAFFATAEAAGARYVLFDRLDAVSERYLRPVLVLKARGFCLMRVTPATGTTLFGLLPGAAAVPELTAADLGDEDTISFELCAAEYWRSVQAMELYRGM
jgi:hypothetical protein